MAFIDTGDNPSKPSGEYSPLAHGIYFSQISLFKVFLSGEALGKDVLEACRL